MNWSVLIYVLSLMLQVAGAIWVMLFFSSSTVSKLTDIMFLDNDCDGGHADNQKAIEEERNKIIREIKNNRFAIFLIVLGYAISVFGKQPDSMCVKGVVAMILLIEYLVCKKIKQKDKI